MTPEELIAEQLATGYRYQQFEADLAPGEKIRRKLKGLGPAYSEDMTGQSVLDFGCNLGWFTLEACRRGAERAVGVDVDDKRLGWCQRFRDSLKQPWARRAEFVSTLDEVRGTFDLVLSMSVLHHVMVVKGIGEAFREIASFVADGGRLLYEGPVDGSDYIVERIGLELRWEQVEAALDVNFSSWEHVGPAVHTPNREVIVAWK